MVIKWLTRVLKGKSARCQRC